MPGKASRRKKQKPFWERGFLSHGYWSGKNRVGIVSLGFIMDAIYDRYSRKRIPGNDDFAYDLTQLREVCRWTSGFWDFGPGAQRKWNELQNTSRDIQLLTNYLLCEYKARVWGKPILG